MTTRSQPSSPKSGKPSGEVLGRSAATGRNVLRPASKAGSISLGQAMTAVRQIRDGKKK